MERVYIFFFLILLISALTGCGNVLYLSKLGWHQSRIAHDSAPVEEVLRDEGVNTDIRKKIQFPENHY